MYVGRRGDGDRLGSQNQSPERKVGGAVSSALVNRLYSTSIHGGGQMTFAHGPERSFQSSDRRCDNVHPPMSDPDKTIYDRASGTALDTVTAHSAEKDLKCFFSWFCPFVCPRELWNTAYFWVGSTGVDCVGRERGGVSVYRDPTV